MTRSQIRSQIAWHPGAALPGLDADAGRSPAQRLALYMSYIRCNGVSGAKRPEAEKKHPDEIEPGEKCLELARRGAIASGSSHLRLLPFHVSRCEEQRRFYNDDDQGANRYDRGFVAARQTCLIVTKGNVMSSGNIAPASAGAAHLLKLGQVAARLNISRRTLERMIAKGEFYTPLRIGRSRRILESDVEHYLAKLAAARGTLL